MSDSSPLPGEGPVPGEDAALETLERVLRKSSADATEATLRAGVERLTGFAANSMRHTTTEASREISLAAVYDRRVVRVSTTGADAASIDRLIERAEAFARVHRDPDLEIELPGPCGPYPPSKFDKATARDTHGAQVEDVTRLLDLARERNLEAAGYLLSRAEVLAMANSAGLRAHHRGTAAEAALTMRRRGQSAEASGYGAVTSWRADAIRLDDIGVSVANKAIWGGAPSSLPAGRYTVILEPLAVAELLIFLAEGFNARTLEEKDSFLVGRLGERCFSPLLTLRDDYTSPLQFGTPFDGEGWPRRPVTLIDAGRVSDLLYDRATASRMNARPTGHGYPLPNPRGANAANLVLQPGTLSNEELLSGCERAILVTRFWYVRPVDPGTLTATGLTRDGTFLVEGGRVTGRLRDLRWNESLLEAFARVDAVGSRSAVVPMEGISVATPAVRIPGFAFVS